MICFVESIVGTHIQDLQESFMDKQLYYHNLLSHFYFQYLN